MRLMDFTESNVANRWMGVKSIWRDMHFETKRYIKRHLESSLRIDMDIRLGCSRYERSSSRRGYRNGSYSRDLLTRYGWIEDIEVPRARRSEFQPRVLDRYRRRQGCIDRVLLEAFLLGHSTRKTRRLFSHLFEGEISAQAISNIVKELDSSVDEFRCRRFDDCRYSCVYLDGLWITLSKPLKHKAVVLVALGIRPDGSKELISFQLASSEAESWWWGFLTDLKDRGLRGDQVELMVSDGAPGLVKAITALYPRVKRQLCTFHKANDLGAHLRDRRHRNQIFRHALSVFEASTQTEVRKNLRRFIDRWKALEPKAVRAFTRGFEHCLTFLEFPENIRSSLKTNNKIERYLQEIRRRIIPMRAFNNIQSAERIIYGIIAINLNQNSDMPNNTFTQLD